VEDQIAVLEAAAGGGLAFATGMAAISAVLSLFNPGDVIYVPGNLYGGTFRILDKYFSRYGLHYRFVDVSDPEAVELALAEATSDTKPNTAIALFIESPTNPLLEVADIAALSAAAGRCGALTIVDNTFMSPYLQRPLTLGADIVIHSATKYLGGHSDVLAGLVAVKDPSLYKRLHFIQYSTGATLAAFDSYLLARGIKTLAVRMDRACENALKIAQYLESDKRLARVIYPGLAAHPGYAIQQKQAAAGGALLAFELAADLDAQSFAQKLKLITVAESLGAVESLLCHPASMTHASIPAALRAEMGISDSLLRLSVGIEHAEDLIADIQLALEAT
jgi:cystathionine beta-lyase